MELGLTLFGVVGLILIASGLAFFRWGKISGGKADADSKLDVQEAIAEAMAKPAPRGLGLRNWVRRNRDS